MDMYSVLQLYKPRTYPFHVSRLSTGSALTAAHFWQTAPKVSKRSLPLRTALAALRCPSLRSRSVGTLRRAIHGPIAALPASMPVDPLRETSSRPPEGAADQDQDQKPSQKPGQKPSQKLGQKPDQKLDHKPSYFGFTLTGARPCAHWHSNQYCHPIPHPKQQSTARWLSTGFATGSTRCAH